MRISITTKDINLGCHGDGQYCPTAIAIRRATGANYVHVGIKYVSVYALEGYSRVRRKIPRRLADWIERFDNGKRVRPIRFSMDLEAAEVS